MNPSWLILKAPFNLSPLDPLPKLFQFQKIKTIQFPSQGMYNTFYILLFGRFGKFSHNYHNFLSGR